MPPSTLRRAHLHGLLTLLALSTVSAACPAESNPPIAAEVETTVDIGDAADATDATDVSEVDAGPEIVLTAGRCGAMGQTCEEGCESSLTCVCALTKTDGFPFRLYEACDAEHPCAAGEVCGPGVRNPRSFCHAESECTTDADCSGLPVNEARCLLVSGGGVCIEAGEASAGELCVTTETCGAGLLCIQGACRAECDPAAAGCATGEVCLQYTTDGLLAGTGGCVPSACDPFSTTNTCPGDTQCVPDGYDPVGQLWVGRCAPSADVDCEFLDCEPGSMCRPGSIGSCEPSCDPFLAPAETGCEPGLSCTALYDDAGRIVRGHCDRTPLCDPGDTDDCSSLYQCFPGLTADECAGQLVGDRAEGDPCQSDSIGGDGCQRGLVCTPGNAKTGVCRAVCRYDAGDCASTALCTPVFLEEPTVADGSEWVSQPFGACRPRCAVDDDCTGLGETCWQSWGVCLSAPVDVGFGTDCPAEGRPCGDDRLCHEGACWATCTVDDERLFGRPHPSCKDDEVCHGRALGDSVGVCRTPVVGCGL